MMRRSLLFVQLAASCAAPDAVVADRSAAPLEREAVWAWSYRGVDWKSRLGADLAVCDVNGDGTEDLIGTSGSITADTLYVWLVDPALGLPSEPVVLEEEVGPLIECAGDLDLDGFEDLVSLAGGFILLPGGPQGPTLGPGIVVTRPRQRTWDYTPLSGWGGGEQLDFAIAMAGERQGEVEVYAPGQDGLHEVYLGRWVDDSWTGAMELTSLDADGDGASELIVADRRIGEIRSLAGLGAKPDWRLVAGGFAAPRSLAGGLDVDGDGYEELLVAQVDAYDTEDQQDQVLWIPGGPNGLRTQDTAVLVADRSPWFGQQVGSAGDLNGDGWEDIAVLGESPDGVPDPLSVFVHLGSPGGPSIDGFLVPVPTNTNGGDSLAALPDLDGDGDDELAIGVENEWLSGDEPDAPKLGTRGAVHVLLGFDVPQYADVDGDGYGDPATETSAAGGLQPGFVFDATDCDDVDPAVHPGADEVPGDAIDQDCDGADLPAPASEGCGCAASRTGMHGAWIWLVGVLLGRRRSRTQMEGAVIFGTSIALYGEVTVADGAVVQSNFHDYRIARMRDAPRAIHVSFVDSGEPPGGIGEPGVPPVAPAIVNGWHALTGERVRTLPLLS